jgi:hypothetical protein
MEDLCPSRAVVRPVLNLMLELIARNNSNTKVVIGLCPPSDSLVEVGSPDSSKQRVFY